MLKRRRRNKREKKNCYSEKPTRFRVFVNFIFFIQLHKKNIYYFYYFDIFIYLSKISIKNNNFILSFFSFCYCKKMILQVTP